jgi:hypothetical protein
VLAAARPDFVVSGEGKSAGINNDDRSIDGFVRILSAKTKGGADERRASQQRSGTQEFGRTQALGSSLGIKPWDEVVSFKALVSQALSNLSDDQTDFAIASPSSAFSDWSWRMRFSTCDKATYAESRPSASGPNGRPGRTLFSEHANSTVNHQ